MTASSDFAPLPTRRLGELVLALDPLFQNPRTITGLDKDSLRELADSIKADDMEDPVKIILARITQPPDRTVRMVDACGRERMIDQAEVNLVVDGQRRLKAGLLLGWKPDHEIDVVYASDEVVELTPKTAAQWERYALRTSGQRQPLSSYELAVAAERARAAGATNAEIGRDLGKSATWVSRFLTAKKDATPELEASWKAGELTDEQVKDLATVTAAKQPEAVKQITELRSTTGRVAKATARAQTKAAAAAAPKKVKNGTSGAVAHTAPPQVKTLHPPPNKILHELVALRASATDVNTRRALGVETDVYSRGVTDGIAYAVGALRHDEFKPAFNSWLKKISAAKMKVDKAAQQKQKAAPAKKAAAKKPARPRRPAKKGKGKKGGRR